MKGLVLEHPDLRDELIEHSKALFRLNNAIIAECENRNIDIFKNVTCLILVTAASVAFVKFFM